MLKNRPKGNMLGGEAKHEKVSADLLEKQPPFISLGGPNSPEVGSKGIIKTTEWPTLVVNNKNSI